MRRGTKRVGVHGVHGDGVVPGYQHVDGQPLRGRPGRGYLRLELGDRKSSVLVIIVPRANGVTEDDVMLAVLEAGAEEVNDLGESFEVISEASDMIAVRTALQEAGIDYESADSSWLPSVSIQLDEEQARKVFRLIEALEDSDDVQDVYANFDVSDEVMAALD